MSGTPASPALTTQLLTRSALNLRRHTHGHADGARAAAHDAALAAEASPHLPAPWLALFSACHAASDPSGARHALKEGLRNCPFDHALRFLATAASASASAAASATASATATAAASTNSSTSNVSGRALSHSADMSSASSSRLGVPADRPTNRRLFDDRSPPRTTAASGQSTFSPQGPVFPELSSADASGTHISGATARAVTPITAETGAAEAKAAELRAAEARAAEARTAEARAAEARAAEARAAEARAAEARAAETRATEAKAAEERAAEARAAEARVAEARAAEAKAVEARAARAADARAAEARAAEARAAEAKAAEAKAAETMAAEARAAEARAAEARAAEARAAEARAAEARAVEARAANISVPDSRALGRITSVGNTSTATSDNSPHANELQRTTLPPRHPSSTPSLPKQPAPQIQLSTPSATTPRSRSRPELGANTHEKNLEMSCEDLLRIGDDHLTDARYRDAVAHYTAIIDIIPPNPTSYISLRALSTRSDAYLRHAIANDDPPSFAAAITDAELLVSIVPEWDHAWLRLGTAHLENACPARGRYCFGCGLEHCPGSTVLADGLRDCEFVIEKEGIESDWEDGDVVRNFREEDEGAQSQADSRTLTTTNHRPEQTVDHQSTAEKGPGTSNATTELDQYRQLPRTSPFTGAETKGNSRGNDNGSESGSVLTNTTATATANASVDINAVMLRGANGGSRNYSAQIDSEATTLGTDSIYSLGYQNSVGDYDSQQSASSRVRLSRQVHRNAAVERLGQAPAYGASLPESGARRAQWSSTTPNVANTREAYAGDRPRAVPPRQTNGSGDANVDGGRSSTGSGEKRLKHYEVLQIPHDASAAAIRKSYFQLAIRYHPDKNAGDERATLRFQEIGAAYAVLSNPETRAVYNRYGDRDAVEDSVDMIDPSTLFAKVFGSEQFMPLIGELQLATLATQVDDEGHAPTEQVLNNIQRRRVGKLVLEMVKMLKPWVDGDKRGFLANMHRMMRRLQDANFGPELLRTVGNIYVQQTAYLQDKNKPFNLSAMMRKATLRSHKMASHHKAMSAAEKVMEKQRKLHDRVMQAGRDHRYISEQEAKTIAEKMAHNAIDMMWKMSVIDIETTLEDVVLLVLCGRDLVADGDVVEDGSNHRTVGSVAATESGAPDRWRSRRRLHSYLSHNGRESTRSRERDREREREAEGDGTERDGGGRMEAGLVRRMAPLTQGEMAVTRQQVVSERAYGIQAMGRIFISGRP